ncbi:unnamed protein product [Caenorhabditis angaria]|uniref:Ubiquitin-like domain-containing protein n=1 Tax=Caenorhabditis angaria TaxID=860376 RepID=A0A9P1IM63_9PELO|nr:unnamed protein product [Caenorhabditis angaria]
MGDSEGGGTSSSSQIEPDEEGSTQNNTTVNIRVKTLSDQECIIPIGLHETVSVLRERIHEHLGIEPSEQRIIFQGRVLVTDRTLQSYSLQDGYTVHMIDRPPESSESFLNTRTGERAANGEHSIRRPRARVHLQQNDPTAADSLLMRQSIGQIMPRLNNLTIEQADGADETINRQAGRFTWRLFLEDNEFSLNRERIELYVRNSIENLPFLTAEDRNRFTLNWVNNELRIDLPRIDPHVASPAFERLAFVELNANYLRVFNDICQEPDGLVTIVRRILDRLQDPENVERMTAIERHEFGQRLEDIIVRLESINSVLPSNRSIDDTRIRNSTEVQRQSRYERIPADRSNPSFVMRHAIDCDLAQVLREFRRQQSRFFEIESLFR